jgi:hypothetical protein
MPEAPRVPTHLIAQDSANEQDAGGPERARIEAGVLVFESAFLFGRLAGRDFMGNPPVLAPSLAPNEPHNDLESGRPGARRSDSGHAG